MKDFNCLQCGKCCFHYYDVGCPTFEEHEYQRFLDAGRYDVIEMLSPIPIGEMTIYDGWFRGDRELDKCPWVRKLPNKNKYKCMIHECKPDVCANYPVDKEQALKIGCEAVQ